MLEYRQFEIRTAGNRKLEGYAAVFDVKTTIGDFTESIRNGAFDRSLRSGRDILALVDHMPNALLGRTKSGSLKLGSDSRGLHFSLDLPDTQLAHDVLALAQRGDIGGASFAFQVPDGGQKWEGRSRTLLDVDLHEISIVSSFPAYPT